MSLEYFSEEQLTAKSKEDLIAFLIRAQQKHKQLNKQLQDVKLSQVELQNRAEAEEELIANTLFKKLEQLEAQKNQLLHQVEQEEEFISNTLQKKLHDLEKDKVRLEERLEEEQEYIVNKLTKQLDEISLERSELQKQVDEGNKATDELLRAKRELKRLNDESTKSIDELKQQNFLLQQQADQHKQKLDSLNRQKIQLERDLEVENEKNFNLGSSPTHQVSPIRLRTPSASSSPSSAVPIPLRSPRTSLGNILQTKILKTGLLLVRPETNDPFREFHCLLSARGILLAFTDADYLSGHAEPELKLVLDKVAAVEAPSGSVFIVRMKDGHELTFKSTDDDAKDASEWKDLIASLIP
jgi:hypothetical protein